MLSSEEEENREEQERKEATVLRGIKERKIRFWRASASKNQEIAREGNIKPFALRKQAL